MPDIAHGHENKPPTRDVYREVATTLPTAAQARVNLMTAAQARENAVLNADKCRNEEIAQQAARLDACVQQMYRVIEDAVRNAVEKGLYTVNIPYYSRTFPRSSIGLFGDYFSGIRWSSPQHRDKARKIVGLSLKERGYEFVWRGRHERLEISWK